jgi:hypothetical protein
MLGIEDVTIGGVFQAIVLEAASGARGFEICEPYPIDFGKCGLGLVDWHSS